MNNSFFYHRFIKKVDNFINRRSRSSLPRQVNIHGFLLRGCKFEISTETEVYRVEEYGDEEEFTRLILKEIKAKDVIFDIGACVGFISVHAAKKAAQVIAFEPDPRQRVRLLTNLHLNKLKNVQVVGWAVSDTPGNVTLYSDGVDGSSPSFIFPRREYKEIVVTDTIDRALQRGELIYPDVVKMDIEGAEILALKGMKKLLLSKKAPRMIFIEIHPDFLDAYKSSVLEVCNFIKSFGYKEIYSRIRASQLHNIYRKTS